MLTRTAALDGTPKALDLFCGAGGATRGLQLAGFHVTGVDLSPQPRYCGDAFHQADAMTFPLDGFDFIWASPPCQGYSKTHRINLGNHPRLIEAIRIRLRAAGVPFVIENVLGAPLHNPVLLCGAMFALATYRHRHFESWPSIQQPEHPAHHYPTAKMGRPVRDGEMISVVGHFSDIGAARDAMGISWMRRDELAQAIPPSYSQHIAEQMLPHILARRAVA